MFRFQGLGPRGKGAEFEVQGSGCRVQGAGCRVQGAGGSVFGAGSRRSLAFWLVAAVDRLGGVAALATVADS